jgi:SAM-dependent methyltransferase
MTATDRAFFDPLAVAYERYGRLHAHVYLPYLEKNLPGQVDRAVDLGCGSGRFTPLLADRADKVLAVDKAEKQVALAAERNPHSNVSYEHRDLMEVTVDRDGEFDALLTVNTLFHLFAVHGAETVLEHVKSLVKPGGVAVIVDVVAPRSRSALRQRLRGLRDVWATFKHSRSVRDAWFVFTFRQSKGWMAHVSTNAPFTPEQFREHYSARFPGAVLTERLGGDPHVSAVRWQRPS